MANYIISRDLYCICSVGTIVTFLLYSLLVRLFVLIVTGTAGREEIEQDSI